MPWDHRQVARRPDFAKTSNNKRARVRVNCIEQVLLITINFWNSGGEGVNVKGSLFVGD